MSPTKPTRPVTGHIPEHLPASDVVVLAQVVLGKGGVSGKDIDNALDSRGTRNWADIGSSSVYNCLNRLEQYKYVEGMQDKRKGHGVKLYHGTQNGVEVLGKELIYRLGTLVKVHDEFDVAIAHLPLMRKQDILNAMVSYTEMLDKALQFIESNLFPMKQFGLLLQKNPSQRIGGTTIGEIDPRNVELILALLERPYRELRARKQWLRELLQKVEDDYVWCADVEPKLRALEIVQDESQLELEKKRKEKGKKGILI